MKLYIMKPVLTRVPIIWSARIRTDLKPARRRTPARRIEIRWRRKQWKELIENDPLIKQLDEMMKRDLEAARRIPAGETVKFVRFSQLPPAATKQIKVEGERI